MSVAKQSSLLHKAPQSYDEIIADLEEAEVSAIV